RPSPQRTAAGAVGGRGRQLPVAGPGPPGARAGAGRCEGPGLSGVGARSGGEAEMSTRTGDEPAGPEPAGAEPAGGDEPIFVEYRPDRRRFLAVVAVFGVVALLLAVACSLRMTVYSPSPVVHAYFQALADRDLAAALRPPDQGAGGFPDDLLQPAVLESDAYLPPSEPDIVEVTVDGGRAEVRVEFTIGDQPATASLRLRRAEEGFLDSLLRRWRIVDGV